MCGSSDLQLRLTPDRMADHDEGSPPPSRKMTTEGLVMAAMEELNSRKGVSLKAIEKFIEDSHHVDMERLHALIKRFILKALADGRLVKAKGIGLVGSFKLPSKSKKASGAGSKKPKPTKIADDNQQEKPRKKKSEAPKESRKKTADSAEKRRRLPKKDQRAAASPRVVKVIRRQRATGTDKK